MLVKALLLLLFLMSAAHTACLDGDFVFGLYPNLATVHGTIAKCDNLTDCIKAICEINDYNGVAYILLPVS